MSLGYRRPEDMKVVNKGDTAELYAYPTPVSEVSADPAEIASSEFTIVDPDDDTTVLEGTVLTDGGIFARFENTTQVGIYRVLAKATYVSDEIRSNTFSFKVEDPFDPAPPTKHEEIANAVWLRFEDLFDSTEGGPWLRDMTLSYFDKNKVHEFINDALLEINVTPPMTTATIIDFTTPVAVGNPDIDGPDTDQPILVLGVELAIIRHLMRSYVEQPTLVGGQAVYEDRRDYLSRWQIIYNMELERYNRWVALWKRQFLNLGHSKVLVTSKAGRLYGPGMRTRNVGRGWY